MTRLSYNLRQAFKQMSRNKGMTFASIFAITAMTLILGLFFVVSININLFMETLRTSYNEAEIYLEDSVTETQAQSMMTDISGYDGVLSVKYRTKEEAMNIMKRRWGENSYLLDSLGENPFPNSIVVTVDDSESPNALIDKVTSVSGVEDVRYYRDTVEKLETTLGYVQTGTLIVMAFLVVVSIVVVSNTIKLTVLAREKEIEIMKYIGAANWFIRGPFLIEGVLMGIISSAIATVAIYFIYQAMINSIGRDILTIIGSTFVPAGYLTANLIVIFLALGISIGACGSLISVRKFLDT